MTFRFEQPELLWLGLLALPLVLLGMRALSGMDRVRKYMAITFRTLLLLLIVAMLAGPHAVREHDHLTVIGLIDISGSVQRFANMPEVPELGRTTNLEYLRWWFREASGLRLPDDRFGLIAFDGQAIAVSAPTRGEYVDDNLDMPMLEGTNIVEAIRLGLAMLPGDTGRRLILASDGNETIGDALEAARQAAGGASDAARGDQITGVPIDVLPIEYRVLNDVQIVRIETPPSAQPGQAITVRMILEATQPTEGRLVLRREGHPIDLDPARPGHSRRVSLPAGQSVHLAQITLGDTPINRFEAIFEPLDPADDVLPDNNRAEAFTATPSRGRALVVSSRTDDETNALARMLRAADIPVEVLPSTLLPDDLLALQNYNLIVLDNVPAYDMSGQQQELLARYVERLGGGLIMIGGDRGFGAGGWMRTPVASILPVDVDPPRELRAPRSALVLVLDKSGSMNRPVAGARATQQEVANEGAALAIESLQAETYVGVVIFDHLPEVYVPLQLNENSGAIADEVRAIRPGGGTRIEPALRTGYEMMRDVEVENRHMVLLTDGISHDPGMEAFVADMAARNIRITTIGVGDDIDREQLQMIADGTGSVFYHVRNPRLLPRVLVDSVQEFNKPLLKEGLFQPVVRATGSTLTIGMDDAPSLGGLVITSPRDDPRVFLEMMHPDGEPLLAHWQVGLGRVAAFTSENEGRWASRWIDWHGAQPFWTQLARTIARPAVSRETELITTIQDDRLQITLEAIDDEEGVLDYLQVDGAVYLPDGRSSPVRLRQTAPGRYEASVAAPQAGVYVVALNPRQGTRQLTPVIGGASRATSEEYRRYESNHALLEEIAEVTGGRMLDLQNPTAVNVFDRADMPRSASMLPMWRAFLIWALIVLLLDVACRRIAWDYPLVRWAVLRAIERVTPSRVKAGHALATLGSLRQVSRQVAKRQAEASRGVEKLKGTGTIAPPPPRPKTPERPAAATPDRSRVAAALDSLLGRSAKTNSDADESRPSATPTTRSAPQEKSDEDAPVDGSTRSSLLAAKRRARQEMEEKKR